MKFAIPTADGRLSMHFGHCDKFVLIEVDDESRKIISEQYVTPPPHEPGLYPRWLAEMGADFIIAGGMGGRALQLFAQNNIRVVTGAPADEPRKIVIDYLGNTLETGENVCNHDHDC